MNEPNFQEPNANAATESCAEVEQCVRRNPIAAIVFAIGAGLLLAMLARALRPEPTPRERAARILEDLEARVREATRPVLRRAGSLACDGADALNENVRAGEASFDRLVRDGTQRLRKLFA